MAITTPPDNQSAFIRLNRDFYQNSGDVVQSDVPLVLMPVVGCWAIRKKLTILSGLPHLSLIHGWPIALSATARPTKPANSTVTGGRGTVVEPSSVIGRRGSGLQARAGSADGRLVGATLLSEVGAGGPRKLESGTGPAHQSPRLRGCRSSEIFRSPRRVRRCHRRPASLPDASAGAELVIALEPPDPRPAALGAGAVLGVDPIVGELHLGATASRRAKPPAPPASALTHECPDAAL